MYTKYVKGLSKNINIVQILSEENAREAGECTT